jgi:hypothetical protein
MKLLGKLINRILGGKYRVIHDELLYGIVFVPNRQVVKTGMTKMEAVREAQRLNGE